MSSLKTVAFHTLGCKLNYAESSSLTRLMEQDGFVQKDFSDVADVYVINTCSVTENADKECRHLVRQIQRKAPSSMVVVTGCYAQLKPQEIADIEGVDLVLGAAEKFNITHHISQLTKGDAAKICSCDIDDVDDFHSSFSLSGRTRTFLKVQDGCDYNCSFCTIPMARGKSRSNSIDKILEEVRAITEHGVKEIVLTGINLGDFRSADNNKNLYTLLQALEKTSIERIRISSIEPNLLTNEIIELVANSNKIMPHFHIPLQSGSNKILGAMRRRYKRELYSERISLIKKLMPHCAIGVDVIVGFPGETDEDFKETFDFLYSLDISYLHVFTYSERDNTHALSIRPIVPIHIRNERNKILRNLSYQKNEYFINQYKGQVRKVLFEKENKNGMMDGYSDNYIKVTLPFNKELHNKIVDWQL